MSFENPKPMPEMPPQIPPTPEVAPKVEIPPIPADSWEQLGVEQGASPEKIQEAYLNVMKKYHQAANLGDPEALKWTQALNETRDKLLQKGAYSPEFRATKNATPGQNSSDPYPEQEFPFRVDSYYKEAPAIHEQAEFDRVEQRNGDLLVGILKKQRPSTETQFSPSSLNWDQREYLLDPATQKSISRGYDHIEYRSGVVVATIREGIGYVILDKNTGKEISEFLDYVGMDGGRLRTDRRGALSKTDTERLRSGYLIWE